MSLIERTVRVNAIQLIAAHGFESMTLRQLAKASGVYPGSLYVYFKSKDDILLDLMHEYLDDLLAEWMEHKSSCAADPRDILKKFVRIYVRHHISRADERLIVDMDWRSLNGEGRALVERLKDMYESELRNILAAGVTQNLFRLEDISLTAVSILAMLRGTCEWSCMQDRCSPDKVFDICEVMALRAVGIAA